MRFQSAEEFRLALETAVAATPAARTIPRLTSRLRGLHPSRAVILMAVVPVTLVAGVYTVRFFPAATHSQPAKSKPRPAALPESHAAQTAPVAAVKVETVEDPGVVPSQPAAVPAVIEKPVAMARPHAAAPARKLRREFEPEQSHAIRVSGADAPPVEAEAEAAPAPCPMPAHSAKAPEACASKPDAVAVPETPDLPMIWGSAPEVPAAPPETSAKPQKSGNRLVRALGKLNPFHKPAKPAAPEASKPPISKD